MCTFYSEFVGPEDNQDTKISTVCFSGPFDGFTKKILELNVFRVLVFVFFASETGSSPVNAEIARFRDRFVHTPEAGRFRFKRFSFISIGEFHLFASGQRNREGYHAVRLGLRSSDGNADTDRPTTRLRLLGRQPTFSGGLRSPAG